MLNFFLINNKKLLKNDMNLKKLKERTEQAIQESERGSNIISFKPDSETPIRFVPSKELGDYGWMPVWVHYSSGGVVNKTTISPKTFGKPDPIEEWVEDELSVRKSTDEFRILMKMKPKLVYITKAVVRGEEDKGVKLFVANSGSRSDVFPWKPKGQWKEVLDEIHKAFKGEDEIPDIADYKEGYDLFVTNISKEKSETGFPEYSYALARKSSPLSKDRELLKELLNEENHPSWKDAYISASYEKLQELLTKFLESGGESEESDDEEPSSSRPSKSSSNDFDEDEILRKVEAEFNAIQSDDEELDDEVEYEDEEDGEEDPF
jgi:hypothetical protein